ncbi:MAG TPA: DUF3592 domain-containing protein [Longimicrobium sp.]|nr:DUF3592 domain-containing protein [Longimicrobium sp.]
MLKWFVGGALVWFTLVPVTLVVVFLARVSRRGGELRLLLQDGVETTGRVTNRIVPGAPTSRRHRYMRYEYRDAAGRMHAHSSPVSYTFWNDHGEGSEVPVVYSASRPAISAPRWLVEQSREAMAKEPARG